MSENDDRLTARLAQIEVDMAASREAVLRIARSADWARRTSDSEVQLVDQLCQHDRVGANSFLIEPRSEAPQLRKGRANCRFTVRQSLAAVFWLFLGLGLTAVPFVLARIFDVRTEALLLFLVPAGVALGAAVNTFVGRVEYAIAGAFAWPPIFLLLARAFYRFVFNEP